MGGFQTDLAQYFLDFTVVLLTTLLQMLDQILVGTLPDLFTDVLGRGYPVFEVEVEGIIDDMLCLELFELAQGIQNGHVGLAIVFTHSTLLNLRAGQQFN